MTNHLTFCLPPPHATISLRLATISEKRDKKALEIVGACLEAVVYLKPKLWLIENPRGRLRQFIGGLTNNPIQRL